MKVKGYTMAQVICFETSRKQTVLIEASDADAGLGDASTRRAQRAGDLDALFEPPSGGDVARGSIASNVTVAAQKSFEEALSAIETTLESLHVAVARVTVPLDTVEVSFGLTLTAGANAIISAGSAANFQFTVTWKTADAAGPSA